jgi:D-tyrosyl-tRNA(Tyr) deacylase
LAICTTFFDKKAKSFYLCRQKITPMRLLIQRVSQASVTINGIETSTIKTGLLLFLGIEESDNEKDIDFLCQKTINLRIFDDENGVMNKSVLDIGGEILVISQFTLHASTKKGNRPSYIRAAKPETAIPLYEQFCEKLSEMFGKKVKTGEFGANMQIELINDGPVTIWMDSKAP